MVKYTLKFRDLNCVKCVEKIKNELQKNSYIKEVTIDVFNQKMELSMNNSDSLNINIEKIKKICLKIEPEMSFIDDKRKNTKSIKAYAFFLGLLLFIIPLVFKIPTNFSFALYLISYFLIGFNVLKKTLFNIKKGILFDENTLMTIATIGAFIIGEFAEGVAVMIFSTIGEYIQDKAISKSRKSISDLMDIKPETANLEINNEIKVVNPADVKIGDIIVVKAGEKIPLDGTIIQGSSSLDTKALTGEFAPKNVVKGDSVLSGSINIDSLIKIKVISLFKDSTVLKILNLIENASSKKSTTENFITSFSKIYTPIVVIIALIVAIFPPLILSQPFSNWIYRSLVFLVISCPCALVISIPLSFFTGIGVASKNGVLIKGSNYLEALNKVSTAVFYKTGTLTYGCFSVCKVKSVNSNEDYLLEIAALAESFSNHPIAKSIISYYNKPIDQSSIIKYEEFAGHGISIELEDKKILAGNKKLMDKFKVDVEEIDEIGTKIYISENNTYIGYILISDRLKENSKKTISSLKNLGVNTVMLTGDNKKVSEKVQKELGIKTLYAELLPHEKLEYVEKFTKEKEKNKTLMFIGDGINDAPSLSIADIGISMGKIGTDAAIEASDIVIIDDDPYKIIKSIKIAKQTRKTSIENITISLGVKLLILLLGFFGLSSIWAAILSDVGVSVIVILNSVKLLKSNKI